MDKKCELIIKSNIFNHKLKKKNENNNEKHKELNRKNALDLKDERDDGKDGPGYNNHPSSDEATLDEGGFEYDYPQET